MSADRIRVWIARFAAPLVFFLAATVLVILVQRALESDSGEARSDGDIDRRGRHAADDDEPGRDHGSSPCAAGRSATRVRSGDTLESIAEKCDVSLSVLLELNPSIDPLALNPGDRIRLRAQQDAT